MRSCRHLHIHPKCTASSTPQCKEQILVLAAIRRHVRSVRKHCSNLHDVVDAQAERVGQRSMTAAGDPTSSWTDSSTAASHDGDVVRFGKFINSSEALSSPKGHGVTSGSGASIRNKIPLEFDGWLDVVRPQGQGVRSC